MFTSLEEEIVARLDAQFNDLKGYVFGQAQSEQLHGVERGIFRRLLQLGLLLLGAFLEKRGDGRMGDQIRTVDGRELKYHGSRTAEYFSIFGKLTIRRAYYWAVGPGEGVCPLDALLNLPQRCYSYLLEDWATRLGVRGAFDKALDILEGILGLKLSKSSVEESVRDAADDVQGYYEQKAAPKPDQEGSIGVVTADGKGVVMRGKGPQSQKKRLSAGEKRSKKKQATVTAVYTIDRHERTAEEIVGELRQATDCTQPEKPSPVKKRPVPKFKRVRATLGGKDAALKEARRQVQERDPKGDRVLVGLADGDRSLQKRMKRIFPGIILILDLLHALEYLWKVAHVFHGEENSPEAEMWVGRQLRLLLEGKLGTVLREMKNALLDTKLSKSKRKTLEGVIRYYSRNRRHMKYDQYLAMGFPIGSGVVEGTCRHLVKDRMELAGMRWVVEGAEAMLELRAVDVNGDWDEFTRYRTTRAHERLYAASALAA